MENSNKVKLPYALKDGKLIHISEVDEKENGLKCNCICPGCKEDLLAKKGKIKIHHFAHKPNSECQIGFQSMLHILAKEIFLETKRFEFIKPNGGKIPYNVTEVVLENKIGSIIPDIVLNCEGKLFFVEIFVTHAIGEEKKEKIKELDISTLEYDLSKVDRNIDKERLKNILSTNPKVNWVYDADEKRVAKKKEFLFENGEKIIPNRYGEVQCPFARKIVRTPYSAQLFLEQYYVFEDFCNGCLFYSGKNDKNESFCGSKFSKSSDFDFATLVTKNKVLTNVQLKNYSESLFGWKLGEAVDRVYMASIMRRRY